MISILNAYHVFSYKHLYVQKKISIIWVNSSLKIRQA